MSDTLKSKEKILTDAFSKCIEIEYIIGDYIEGKADVYESIYEAMEQYASLKQSGMRWTRADERLPELEKNVHAKLDGVKIFGHFYEILSKKRFCVNDRLKLTQEYVAEEDFKLIEWLDESVPHLNGKLIEAAKYAHEKLNEIRKYCSDKKGYDVTVIYNETRKPIDKLYEALKGEGV